MRRTKANRLLAVFLAIVMALTMTTTISFAAIPEDNYGVEKENTNLLVFGASTSSGYGLADFTDKNSGFNVRNNDIKVGNINGEKDTADGWEYSWNGNDGNAARISEYSYPWQLKEYIAKERFNGDLSKVNLSALTINGMRNDEFRALLDEDYYEKAFDQEKAKTWYYTDIEKKKLKHCGFLGEHVDTLIRSLRNGDATLRDGTQIKNIGGPTTIDGRSGFYGLGDEDVRAAYGAAQQYVREQIEDADVVVMDNCMNNFGTYLGDRINGFAGVAQYAEQGMYWKQNLDDIDGVSDRTWSELKVLKKEMMENPEILELILDNEELAGMASDKFVEQAVDSFLYCYADCVTNFSANVKTIRELNPNAKIIAVGVYNTLDGINIEVDGNKIDFGAITSRGFDLVNAYIKGLDKNSPNYYFADTSGGRIETAMMMISNADDFDSFMATDEGKALMDNMYSCDPAITDTSFKESFMGSELDDALYKKTVQKLLFDAAHHTTIDIARLMNNVQDLDAMKERIKGVIINGDEPTDEILEILQIVDRFMLYMGIGQHPSKNGCLSMSEAVLEAYTSEYTAYEEMIAEYIPYLNKLLEQLKTINGLVKEAVAGKDFDDISQELMSIGQKLLAIGETVAGLPEYEEAMEQYLAISKDAMAQMRDDIDMLKAQNIKLIAKSIDATITSEVSFPNNTVLVKLSWEVDEDADGYILRKNGEDVDYEEGESLMTFEDPDVQVGQTCLYELIPYVIGNDGEAVKGKTFKSSVTPKVSVNRTTLKKVTAKKASFKATWKAVKGAGGYQLSYKTGKTTKVKTYDSARKLSATVKGLKANPKYTVKVRAYKTVNNVKYFGAWSKAKKSKIKP